MEDKIQPFRQPIVTGGGILLGFILNFASEFVKSDTRNDSWAILIGIFILTGVILIIVSITRVLKINYPREHAEIYYNKTLSMFIAGIAISFIGVLIKMVQTFLN
jgi:Na+/melibiose symporter-like transporter